MKKLGVLIVLVVLAVLIMPYVTGRVAESASSQMVGALNEKSDQYGDFVLQDYDRTYRTTTTKLEWSPPMPYAALLEEPLRFTCLGEHGVMSFDYDCKAENAEKYTEFVQQELNGEDPLRVGGSVSLLGTAIQRVSLEPLSLTDEVGEKVELDGAYFQITSDLDFTQFEVDGKFNGARISGISNDMTVLPGSVGGSLYINQHDLLMGDVTFRFDGLQAKPKTGAVVQLSNITMKSEARENGELMDMLSSLRIGRIEQQDEAAGSGDEIDDLDVNFNVTGVNMKEFSEVNQKYRELSQLSFAEEFSAEQESNFNAQMLSLIPELEDLFTGDLALSVDLGAQYKKEPMTAAVNLDLKQAVSFSDFLLLTVQPEAFLQKLDLSIKSVWPNTVVESNPEMWSALPIAPYYQQTDDGYSLDLSASEKGIVFNGQTLSIEEFMALLGAAGGY